MGILCTLNNQTIWYLSLDNYGLNGFIPDTINQLSNLTILDLSNNNLHGTIPESLYGLSQLRILVLEDNRLNGTISSSISSLTFLSYLAMDYNELTGSIPDGLFNLPLIFLDFAVNKLNGKIPNTIGNCSQTLEDLQLSNNLFSSTLPDSLYNLQKLSELIISNNMFTGTISEKFANMPNLIGITAEENYFFGRLPSNIFNQQIATVEFAVNLLSGRLPSSAIHTNDISLNGNSFTGTVPESFWNSSSSLWLINLAENFFHGQVVFESQQLQGIALSGNMFSGTLPSPTFLSLYSLNSNFYTGTVPTNLWSPCSHVLVDISENYLHGSFYQTNITNLFQSINISYNLFSGSFSFLTNGIDTWLNILSISNNFFSGTFMNDWKSFSFLIDLDISSNSFAGDLPTFLPLSLQVFSASTNCFRGSFPQEWCLLGNMTSWILNGLSSSSYCQKALFPGTSIKTFVTKYGTTNPLPACLLELPSLESLFLSGNELTGTLPNDYTNSSTITPSLLNLDLSHNRLIGTIPVRIQERMWIQLDLSFNLLGGTLSSFMYSFEGSGSFLKLERNRLSGSVPSSLLNTENINILDGNLFSCSFDSSALPTHDPSVENYSCGSDTTNAAIYLWLGFMGVLSVLIGLGVWIIRNKNHNIENEHDPSFLSFLLTRYKTFHNYCVDVSKVGGVLRKCQRNIGLLRIYNEKMRQTAFLISGFSMLVFLPLLSILSLFYSVYSERYSWVLSGLFLEGEGSAVALFMGYLIFVTFFLYVLNRIWLEKSVKSESASEGEVENAHASYLSEEGNEHAEEEDKTARFMIYALAGAINLTVMLLVDFVYVYIVINYDTIIITMTVMTLSLIKIIWNSYLMWIVLVWCRRTILPRIMSKKENEVTTHFTKADIAFVSLSLGLNNLIYPAIALLILSTNCYQNAFFQSSEISSSYQYNVTWITDTQESATSIVTSDYLPPFSYSYQCASVVYAYYSPLFIFMFIFEGLLFPVIELIWMFIRSRSKVEENRKEVECEGGRAVEMVSTDQQIFDKSEDNPSVGTDSSTFLKMMKVLTFFSDADDITSHSILFHKHRYMVRFNSYLLIMMIYGPVFPPVALIGFVSIITRTLLEEVLFGHILELSKKGTHFKDEVERKLSNDCSELTESMESLLYIVLPIPTIIYCYLVFDTFGQDTPVVIALIPAEVLSVLYVMILMRHGRCKSVVTRKTKNDEERKEVKNPIIESMK